ncbi:hypothetical protein CXM95_18430 (plasmid) [Enterococcus sp. CR-Ec1]|nr:hypothetical protein CXM95_18430 [Enterococcus sp. CR-Ec1]
MRLKRLIIFGVFLAPAFLGSDAVIAATYPNATNATTDANIEFEKDDDPVGPVDPTDPEKPVDPEGPINPNGSELMITYVSKLNFGMQEKASTTFSALGDKMSDGSYIVPIVSVKDSRGSDRAGWTLTAKVDGDFTDSTGHVLQGAEVTYSNLHSGNGQSNAPYVIGTAITLNKSEQAIAGADSTNGVNINSIGLGELQNDNTTNGVTLTVPKSSVKNTAQYTTTITYNLTADPFSSGSTN